MYEWCLRTTRQVVQSVSCTDIMQTCIQLVYERLAVSSSSTRIDVLLHSIAARRYSWSLASSRC